MRTPIPLRSSLSFAMLGGASQADPIPTDGELAHAHILTGAVCGLAAAGVVLGTRKSTLVAVHALVGAAAAALTARTVDDMFRTDVDDDGDLIVEYESFLDANARTLILVGMASVPASILLSALTPANSGDSGMSGGDHDQVHPFDGGGESNGAALFSLSLLALIATAVWVVAAFVVVSSAVMVTCGRSADDDEAKERHDEAGAGKREGARPGMGEGGHGEGPRRPSPCPGPDAVPFSARSHDPTCVEVRGGDGTTGGMPVSESRTAATPTSSAGINASGTAVAVQVLLPSGQKAPLFIRPGEDITETVIAFCRAHDLAPDARPHIEHFLRARSVGAPSALPAPTPKAEAEAGAELEGSPKTRSEEARSEEEYATASRALATKSPVTTPVDGHGAVRVARVAKDQVWAVQL